MHRYREYGVVSEQDEQFRRAFRDGFKGAGLSHPQFLDALAWYRDHAQVTADEAQLTEAFMRFADERNWSAEHRDGVAAIYRQIRDGGAAAVIQKPSPEQDRAVLARADHLLRTDPKRYWDDGELQDAAFEAQERLGNPPAEGRAEVAEVRSSQDRQRVVEIEGLLRDPTGDGQRRYWSDASLRADYGAALARLQVSEHSIDPANLPGAAPDVPGLNHPFPDSTSAAPAARLDA